MLTVVTAKEMQDIDRVTSKKYGIPGIVLMERAGLAVTEKINSLLSTVNSELSTVVVLCGGGNNGGDGFVIARLLHNQGRSVEVYLTARPRQLKGDAKINYNAAIKFGVKIFPIKKFLTRCSLASCEANGSLITRHCLIVDALLGTGLSKDVRPPLSTVINKINKKKFSVVSVDIPSGISSDTGQIMGCAVRADQTVTFGLPKRGHVLFPGAEYTGNLHVADIGFPGDLLDSNKVTVNMIQRQDAVSLMPGRPRYSHKGTYGHVLIVAGSKGKTGAALMAARACLRSGGTPATLVNSLQSRVTEEMILPLPDKGDGTLSEKASDSILLFLKKRANVFSIGPGISYDSNIEELIVKLILGSNVPVVIDADGINALAPNTIYLKKAKSPVILTPHPGEMARLISGKKSIVNSNHIEKDRIETPVAFAKKSRAHIVLKGVPTVIAGPDGRAFLNTTGNSGMATAGTGDVLTGMISAFLAQGLKPQDASILGVYLHGLTGDISAEKKGKHSLIASDMIREIPRVLKLIKT
jgi:NAD(P)H-hydrate epimerase